MKEKNKLWRRWIPIIVYLSLVFSLTFGNREPEPARMAWTELFGSYRRAWEERHDFILWGLIDNILMMVPLGILLPWMSRRFRLFTTMLASLMLSLFIECTQYFTRLGYFDVDDIWNNLWGTLIGYGLFTASGIFRRKSPESVAVRCLRLSGLLPLLLFVLVFGTYFHG